MSFGSVTKEDMSPIIHDSFFLVSALLSIGNNNARYGGSIYSQAFSIEKGQGNTICIHWDLRLR
jgi:predicted outer membrane repeat protein